MKSHWSDLLTIQDACDEAVEWAKTQPSLSVAWAKCERSDWMLWLAARVGVDRKLVVLAACACARTSLKYVPKGEKRPRIAIETAERWAKGKATLEEVIAARNAASAAAYAADAASAAAYAAYAAAYVAAYVAAYAAAYAADVAAYAAAYAAYAAYVARKNALKGCAALVRKTISARRIIAATKGKSHDRKG